MKAVARALRRYSSRLADQARRIVCPEAQAFYTKLMEGGYQPNVLIDVLPEQRIICVCVPKCASARIKKTLSALLGWHIESSEEAHARQQSALKNPKGVGISTFWRVAADPAALRFSFVRNPYARLVSLWAHQFRNRPLVPGLSSINSYLASPARVDLSLPKGADGVISFKEFVTFVTATAKDRIDAHWTPQSIITDMPGITLDLIGKVETFAHDFSRVLEHVHADPAMRTHSVLPFNASDHDDWRVYYTTELANMLYRGGCDLPVASLSTK